MFVKVFRWLSAALVLFGLHNCVADFDQTTHFEQMREQLQKCRDYSLQSKNVMRIQFYANRTSGCSILASMRRAGSLYGFKRATLAYQVYFPIDHVWGKGGKLHGTLGGVDWSNQRCYGGVRFDTCHSSRIMFRRQGQSLLYLYTPDKCHFQTCAKYAPRIQPWCCQPGYSHGLEMDTGVVSFKTGAWNNVSISTTLGTGAESNVTLRINGRATTVAMIPMQLGSNQSIRTTMFTAFYGGRGPEWFPEHDTYALFTNFTYSDLIPYTPPPSKRELLDEL
jgi:hypothetical protein